MSDLQRAGTRQVHPSDITGRRALHAREHAREEAEEHALAVDRAMLELRDPDTQLAWVTVPGRSAVYPVPKEVLRAIQRAAR